MIAIAATVLVGAGVLILGAALVPVRRLMLRLPSGAVRDRWYLLAALIGVFIAGYLGYAAVFWGAQEAATDLIVPVIFLLGACFVWLVTVLSHQTALDVIRLSVLEQQAHTDPLTGVSNRRALDRSLAEELTRARRYRLPLSILLIDVDHFKRINDAAGHQAGDRVLVELARVAQRVLRQSDSIARFGGEELLVVAPNTARQGAAELADRIRTRIEVHDFGLPASIAGAPLPAVTASFGIASIGEGVEDVDKLLWVADRNLYRAKAQGRNRVIAEASFADPLS